MKTLHIASILAVVGLTAFACTDTEDRLDPGNTAGKSGSGTAGSKTDAGAGGAAGEASDVGGAAGANEGGEAGAGGDVVGGAGGAAGAAGAAGAGGEAPVIAPFELIGVYDESFGGTLTITADAWNDSALAAYDNAKNVAYTQFPADDMYSPNLFAKVVYTEPTGGSFYYCTIVYDAVSLADAQASTKTTDASNPDTTGCGPFPWSKVTVH